MQKGTECLKITPHPPRNHPSFSKIAISANNNNNNNNTWKHKRDRHQGQGYESIHKLITLKMKAVCSFITSGSDHPNTQHNNPKDLVP
jgi:hypothetical protein